MRLKKGTPPVDLAATPGARVLGVVLPSVGPMGPDGPAPRYTLPEDRRNKGEKAYGEYLARRKQAGEIVDYSFEPEKFRLADNTYYTPDYRVLLADGTVEFHEVKGRKGDGFYATEDGWIKAKMAAEVHPYPFRVLWPRKGGGWDERLVKRGAR